jgi:predicted nucleotidyltransferase
MAAGERTNISQTTQTKGKFDGKIPFITSLITSSIDKKYLKKIYLFGSYAYGKQNEDSDIDIFVIIDDNYDDWKAYMDTMHKFWNNDTIKVIPSDLIICKESEFNEALQRNSKNLENVILKEGMVLYGSP